MKAATSISGPTRDVRGLLWTAGGFGLLGMGGLTAAAAGNGILFHGGGLIVLPLYLLPLLAGFLVVFSLRWARTLGVLVSTVFGGYAASLAIYPLNADSPPPGQVDMRQLDMGMAAVAMVFLASGAAILVGRARGRS